ncbi:MAG: hypothetical protein WCD45_06540 [Gallionella sp.]
MGETLLLTTIITLIVLAIRRSKPVVLDNPVIMHRPGKYHITLAPQLNRAQGFIEDVAKLINTVPQADSATQYFCVYDEKVHDTGEKFYLLAVSTRGGIAYFQAVKPQHLKDGDSDLQAITAFSTSVMFHHPLAGEVDASSTRVLHDAVLSVAQNRQIKVAELLA